MVGLTGMGKIIPLISSVPSTGSESFIDPLSLVEGFDLQEGMRVADFGAGSGYFTLSLAEKVGPTGQVTAVDILENILSAIRSQAAAKNLNNLQTVRADLEVVGGSGLMNNSQDLVLLANILFQSSKKMEIIKEAQRVLKSGGQLVVIDWREGASSLGPPPEMRIKESALQKQIEAEGFKFKKELETGNYHFGLMFVK